VRINTTTKRFISVGLLLAMFIFASGCAVSDPHFAGWEYKEIQRFDYPGLNDDSFRYIYAFPWREQLSRYEQQGWKVDSVSITERKLESGQKTKSAVIVLKRPKKHSGL
jgi:hypothetical protein